MSYVVVDVESDGPIIGLNSMVCFGAVVVDECGLNKTFYGQTRPLTHFYDKDALAISGFTREEHLKFNDPEKVFLDFKAWLKINTSGAPVLISDNNGYDASWINYYVRWLYE